MVPKEFSFEDGLISWIHVLYVEPQPSIYTNNVNFA